MNNNRIILSIIALLAYATLLAQPPAPPATPIDGGLSLLLLGGAAYGVNKIIKAKKNH